MPITITKHPKYTENQDAWELYRAVFEGGKEFITNYLRKLKDEDDTDFSERTEMTYNPAFAKEGVIEVINSIYQRLNEVRRSDGDDMYHKVVQGALGGIDLQGSTMNYYMGVNVLNELAFMGRVGIYVDSFDNVEGTSVAEKGDKHPYIYTYAAEDIYNWVYNDLNPSQLDAVLLRDYIYVKDESGLPKELQERFRLVKREKETITVQFYDASGKETGIDGTSENSGAITLNIPEIPFVMPELSHSLLKDVAQYQVTLLNIESSDVWYILRSNIPYYVEKYADNDVSRLLKRAEEIDNPQGTDLERSAKVKIGTSWGRKIPQGVDFPQFVSPPSEPLEASMRKQEKIKEDIRMLLALSLSNMKTKSASAESKALDVEGMEAGLSYIGMELEATENSIARIWSAYEGSQKPATVKYPEKWDLKTDSDRRNEAKEIDAIKDKLPSPLARRLMLVDEARILLEHKTSPENMSAIIEEILNSDGFTSDIDQLSEDLKQGLVSTATASKLRGYKPQEVEQAKQDQAERLKRIQVAQTKGDGANAEIKNGSARGVDDQDPTPGVTTDDEGNKV